MPLQDRAEYRAWLARRDAEDRRAGRRGNAEECAHCGVGANEQELHGESCIVCLAEQFGIDSTEERIAGLVHSFVLAAAGDQRTFVRRFQEATWALSEATDAHPSAS